MATRKKKEVVIENLPPTLKEVSQAEIKENLKQEATANYVHVEGTPEPGPVTVVTTSDDGGKVVSKAIEKKLKEVGAVTIPKGEEKSETQQFLEFVSDPEEKKRAIFLAEQIQALVNKKWFTIKDAAKASRGGETPQSIYQKMQILELFKLTERRIGTAEDGREKLRQELFKIVISKQDKILAIDDIIAYHRGIIEKLESQKLGLLA